MATRAEIEARMADILNRQDFATRITVWFERAYTSLQRRFNFKCMEVTEYMNIAIGMTEFPAPTDIKKSVLLHLYDSVTNKKLKSFTEATLEEVREAWGNTPSSCKPIFTNWFGTILFAPAMNTQEAGKSLRYDYFRYLVPTNNDWFMTHAEDFLVYRGLAESAPFLAADPRLQTWALFQKEAFEELWRAEVDQKTSGPLQMRG